MALSLYSPTNFQYSMVIFCRPERKSLHLLLPRVLRRSHETRIICEKKLLACQILRRKYNGRTSSSTRMLLFWQRHKDNPQKNFWQKRSYWEIYLYDTCSLVASLIITLTFHCTLHLIPNEWSRKLEKISVDPRPQATKDLKQVCGLKLF